MAKELLVAGDLAVSATLSLPPEGVTEVFAWIGRRGSGKTYGATKMAEEYSARNYQFIALDPVGIWYGLRLDGEDGGKGIDIPIFGGLHGDLPIEPTGGALIADIIVDRNICAVIDVSQFESDADKARFVTSFADRFFFRKKASPSPVHVFIEEAQEFVPQNPQKDEIRMLHVMQRMIRLGRNYGIGASMISQRPQDVNKKALNQAECVFAFQLTGPQEIKAIADWVSEKGEAADDLKKLLPALQRGHAHVWSPAWLRYSGEVLIAKKRTFPAGSTPKVGSTPLAARPLTPIDISNLRDTMAATIERAKEDDPRELRKRIRALEAAANSTAAAPATTALDEETVRMLKEQMETLTANVAAQEARSAALENVFAQASELVNQLAALFSNAEPPMIGTPVTLDDVQLTYGKLQRKVDADYSTPGVTVHFPAKEQRSAKPSDGSIPKGERDVLIVLAQHGTLERNAITAYTGFKRSTRDAYLQRLKQRGYVDGAMGNSITITTTGLKALGSYEKLPTGRALLAWWIPKLPEGEAKILQLAARSQRGVSRDEITEKLGFKRSTRDAYIQRLAQKLLVTTDGHIKAVEALFD